MSYTIPTIRQDDEFAAPPDSEMEVVFVPDRSGINRLKLQIFEGKYYISAFKPSVLQGVRTLNLRSDDIYFPSFLRTGTHWTLEMTNMLLQGKAETIPRSKGRDHIELFPGKEFEEMYSPRVLCSHMWLSDAPEQLLQKKCKVIYKLRDPKDVAVSLYNIYRDIPTYDYRGEFKDFLPLFLEGKVDCNGIFNHMRDAEKFFDDHPEIPVHIQVYEDTVENPVSEVQKLSDFLGVTRDNGLCKRIVDKCQFSKLKTDKDAYTYKIDGKSILFRKGTVGDWKNWFTDELLEEYYDVYEEKMKGSIFYARYSRDKYEN